MKTLLAGGISNASYVHQSRSQNLCLTDHRHQSIEPAALLHHRRFQDFTAVDDYM